LREMRRKQKITWTLTRYWPGEMPAVRLALVAQCGRSRAADPSRAVSCRGEADGTRLGRSQRLYAILHRADIVNCPAVPHQMVTPRHGARPTILTTLGIFFCFAGIAWGCWISTRTTFEAVCPTCSAESAQRSGHPSLGYSGTHAQDPGRAFGDATVPASGAQEGPPWTTWPDCWCSSTVDCGGDDCSLASQAKLLRADSNDRIDRLTEAFDKYAENVAETNSKALVTALSEVVREFNVKINEQFGGNFRQLNSGVERLISWQVQYEHQLEALIRQETRPGKHDGSGITLH